MQSQIVKNRLEECEEIIERGLNTFVDVGMALLEIRDSRLYKEIYSTFEDYCRERWGMERRNAYQLIDAAQVVENVRHGAQILPANERQARPLAGLLPEQQSQIWQQVIDTAPEGKITGKFVQKMVASLLPPDGKRGIVRDRIERGNGIVKCSVCSNLYDGSAIEYCPYCAYTQEERIAYLQNKTRPENIHISDESYEWYTPEEYVEAARIVMGGIDLDPASSKVANKTVKASKYFTKEDDGLSQDWSGNIFLNPPYNMPLIEDFTSMADNLYKSNDIEQAIIIVNNGTETSWFQNLLSQYSVCFPKGRLKFYGPHASQARQGQAIFYLGKKIEKFRKEFSGFGVVVRKI